MADLVRRRVAVIASFANAPALAAKAATTTIPIVFGVGQDPVRMGLVASLARPGGNATGINFFNQEAGAKRLGLLHNLVPKAVRIAVLVNPANASATEPTLQEIGEAARVLGLQIAVLKLLIQALQEKAEGKIDRLAAWLSQINLRLDVVPGIVFEPRPRHPPRAYAERLAASHTTELAARFGWGLLLGGYLNPASFALHATPTLASKGRLIR